MTITTMQCVEISDHDGYFVLHFYLMCADELSYGNGSYGIQVNGTVEDTYYDEAREVYFVSKLTATSFSNGTRLIEIGKFYDLDLQEI